MGKPKHSDDPRGEQQGAQTHAEGDHGDKSYSARKAEINNDGRQLDTRSQRAAHDPNRGGKEGGGAAQKHDQLAEHPGFEPDGGHRLFENRTQHDEAEQGSERNRRDRDVARHAHDGGHFQGHSDPGGRPEPDTVKNTGRGGGNRSDQDRGR